MIQIKISQGYLKRYSATLEEWDLGVPFGDGDTIQEALEDFLELYEMKYDEIPKFKWS